MSIFWGNKTIPAQTKVFLYIRLMMHSWETSIYFCKKKFLCFGWWLLDLHGVNVNFRDKNIFAKIKGGLFLDYHLLYSGGIIYDNFNSIAIDRKGVLQLSVQDILNTWRHKCAVILNKSVEDYPELLSWELYVLIWVACCKTVSFKIFVAVIPKEELAGGALPILLLVWQWHRS